MADNMRLARVGLQAVQQAFGPKIEKPEKLREPKE